METTAELPWVQFWIICTNPCDSNWSAWRRTTTHIDQEMLRLPNQSDWDSRYLRGRNFMAQSWVIKTEPLSSYVRIFNLDWSCLTVRSWWAFQGWIMSLLCFTKYVALSWSFFVWKEASSTATWISSRKVPSSSHWKQWAPWVCWHFCWKQLSLGSLKGYDIQWYAMVASSSTCTN